MHLRMGTSEYHVLSPGTEGTLWGQRELRGENTGLDLPEATSWEAFLLLP